MINQEDKSIILLKEILSNKIEELKKNEHSFKISCQIACLDEIISIMESYDLNYISSKIMQISLNLSTIYDEEAFNIEMEICGLLRNTLKYKNNPFFQEEYEKGLKKLRGFYHRFKNEKEKLDEEYIKCTNLKKIINKYEKYLYKLNYGQRFGKEQIVDIQNSLEEEHIDRKVSLVILESLFTRNNEIVNSTPREFMNSKINKEKLYRLLNAGFENFDIKNRKYSNEKELRELSKIADDTIKCWNGYYELFETDDFKCQLPTLETYDKYKLYNFYTIIMEKIQNKMLEQLKHIQDKDFFMDLKLKKEIMFDFNKYEKLYLYVRNFYDDIFDKMFEEIKLKSEEIKSKSEEIEEMIDKNNDKILFLRNNYDEVFMMKDLKKMNEEYLSKIIKLLEAKKNRTTTENNDSDKQMKSNDKLKQIRELKDDQVRICYKNLSDGRIIIIGCGIKKSNVDYKLLNRMATRFNKYYDERMLPHYIEKAEEDFDTCIEYCDNNKRKGNR